MKIGFVLDDSLDSSDGVQQYILLIGEWMQRKGHEVHYLVGETKRTDVKNVHSMSKNVHVRFNKNRLTVPYKLNHNRMRDIDDSWDVLHVQMPYSPLLAGRIINQANNRTAVVGTFHIAPYNQLVSVSNKLLSLIAKRSLKRFDNIISVSKVAKRFAQDSFDIQSMIIPNAIDRKNWKNNKTRNIDILFLGRLVSRKGCQLLLEALLKMSYDQDLSKLRIVVAGNGPLKKELEEYVNKHGLKQAVKFLGHVSEEKKKDLLGSAKISIFPSMGGESFGIVLLEAMASGSIAIGGNNPGYRSVIGSVNHSIVDTNVEAIAERLSKILASKELQELILADQKKLVQNFDINVVGNDILLMYNEALKKRML